MCGGDPRKFRGHLVLVLSFNDVNKKTGLQHQIWDFIKKFCTGLLALLPQGTVSIIGPGTSKAFRLTEAFDRCAGYLIDCYAECSGHPCYNPEAIYEQLSWNDVSGWNKEKNAKQFSPDVHLSNTPENYELVSRLVFACA